MSDLSPLRKGRITATRGRDILTSHFNTPEQVMREMVREYFDAPTEFEGNIATDWGIEHEADAAIEYENRFGEILVEKEFAVHPDYDWLGSSYDRATTDKLVEIKCPFTKKIPASCPEGYLVQLRIELECDQRFEVGEVFYWTPNEAKILATVEEGLTKEELAKLLEFHKRFREIIADEKLYGPYLEEPVVEHTDQKWADAAASYKAACDAEAAAKLVKDAARKNLIELADKKKSRGAGVSVTPFEKKGNVDYKKVPELKGVDLEQYRAKSTLQYRLTVEKEDV